MRIRILYGTETGNTEMLAEDLASELKSEHDHEVTNMEDADPSVFEDDALFLIVSSTYGEGELPASAKDFVAALEAERPDLSGRRFAIFGMGDTQYPETFGFGSRRIEELLVSLGARRVGERVVHDASSGDLPEDKAFEWLRDVLAECEAA